MDETADANQKRTTIYMYKIHGKVVTRKTL